MKTNHHTPKAHLGFTLMELLIVLVILGLLAAVVAPVLYQRINPAKHSAARTQIENFSTALDNYFVDTGTYPSTEQGLSALRTAPTGVNGWAGPYLKKEVPNDPWKNPFVYKAPGRSGGYEIISLGADGQQGGNDEFADILSWE